MARPNRSHTTKRICVTRGQHVDEDTAESDSQERNQGNERAFEGAYLVRILLAKDDDSSRNDDEGTECTDIGHFSDDVDGQEACRNSRNHADQHGAAGRSLIFRMDVAEEFRQQAIAGHDEEYIALAKAHDQEDRSQAADGADGDSRSTPVIADGLAGKGNRSCCRLEFEVRNHAGEDGRYGDVQDRTDDER